MESSVVVKTPMRISFIGGGTDLPSFYRKYGGEVVSTTIDKYVTVEVEATEYQEPNAPFIVDTDSWLVFTPGEPIGEKVYSPDELMHPIVREALRISRVEDGVKITIRSDLPSRSGLGGSSALTVGLLNALFKFRDVSWDSKTIAQQACEIEIDMLGSPIGKQDQYAASHGGFNRFEFCTDNTVKVQPIHTEHLSEFKYSLLLFDTGIRRDSNKILSEQRKSADPETLLKMRSDVRRFLVRLQEGDIEAIGVMLDTAWRLKRSLTNNISNPELDYIYQKALSAGAWGGKLLGAGGGGHFLFCAPIDKHQAVIEALPDLKHIPFKFEERGSHIVCE